MLIQQMYLMQVLFSVGLPLFDARLIKCNYRPMIDRYKYPRIPALAALVTVGALVLGAELAQEPREAFAGNVPMVAQSANLNKEAYNLLQQEGRLLIRVAQQESREKGRFGYSNSVVSEHGRRIRAIGWQNASDDKATSISVATSVDNKRILDFEAVIDPLPLSPTKPYRVSMARRPGGIVRVASHSATVNIDGTSNSLTSSDLKRVKGVADRTARIIKQG
jgi:hypothetical protein